LKLVNTTNVKKLEKEIDILSRLKHENIICVYNSWIFEDKFVMITELMTSGSLRSFLTKAHKVSKKCVKGWSRQILKGIGYLHNREDPIIHRDIKLDNIFFHGTSGQVKIGDLGFSTFLDSSRSAPLSIIGTPQFMAPEMFDEKYNELVDVWAFGMTVIEICTLDYPFYECGNFGATYKKIITGEKPRSLFKIMDEDIISFICCCLRDVEDRYHADELLTHSFLQSEETKNDQNSIILRSEPEVDKIIEKWIT